MLPHQLKWKAIPLTAKGENHSPKLMPIFLAVSTTSLSFGTLLSLPAMSSSGTATTLLFTRVTVPGHFQRGGSPDAYDRVISTRFGVKAAELIINKDYGKMVTLVS